MIYDLNDMLLKMGAPEVGEKGRICWQYFDAARKEIAGFADIRLEAGGERMVAELKHVVKNYEDDHGKVHDQYTETFALHAERTARPGHYRIVSISMDGEEYQKPAKSVCELAFSVFHARALDISVLMVEQAFNKQDITEPAAPSQPLRGAAFRISQDKKPGAGKSAKAKNDIENLLPVKKQLVRGIREITEKREGYGVVIPFRPRNAERASA